MTRGELVSLPASRPDDCEEAYRRVQDAVTPSQPSGVAPRATQRCEQAPEFWYTAQIPASDSELEVAGLSLAAAACRSP